MFDRVRYLLLQTRNPADPIRPQEVQCFARALQCSPHQITVVDLLAGVPRPEQIDEADIVLLGGSGDHSVAAGGPWLGPALDAMRQLHARSKPTFASCWGFQAMARAMGGRVVTDLARAELGTVKVTVTDAGRLDPVFAPLAPTFIAPMGHQDLVETLPPDAALLASTNLVPNQAFRFKNKPIYCTQFHPELTRDTLMQRLEAYPQYVERIAGVPMAQFEATCVETPEVGELLRRFVGEVVG